MQIMNLSFAGIYSNTNNLNDQTINGGLLKADNIVIDQPNVAKSRRGQKKYNTYTEIEDGEEVSKPMRSFATYKSTLLAFTDDKLLVDDGYGSYTVLSSSIKSPLPSKKFHYVESNKNFYYCDENGVFKLDSLSSTPKLAGVPQALQITRLNPAEIESTVEITSAIAGSVNLQSVPAELVLGSRIEQGSITSDITNISGNTLTLSNTVDTFALGDAKTYTIASGTAIEDLKQVAYRVLFGYKDLNNNLILGAPSDRKIFQNNSGGVVNVKGRFPIPKGIDTSFFFQVYRSTATDYDPGNNVDVTPDDELQLIVEEPVKASDLSNGYIEFTDSTPDSLMGAFLYTNETQDGITQANYQPPLCQDVDLYKNCVFFANTKNISTLSASLLSASSLSASDTISIGSEVFTAGTDFQISSDPDPALAIEQTIQSFIDAVNSRSACKCYAFYSSSDSDIPGKFTLQAKDKNEDNITVTSSVPTAFYPELNNLKTVAETNVNRVYFSKPQQPEAVPLLNYIDVGSANYEIKRIVALRDSLFILKSDGIYRISGESASSFTCKLFDGTTSIIASETAVAFNNMVYAVADQGIITISETGVSIISMPIENDLFELSEYANFATLSFAVAYASDRKYILFVPSKPDDTTCTQAFIYNSYTQTFVRWDMSRSCGVVRPNEAKQGELFLGTVDGITYIERKTFTIEDYSDDEYQVTIIDSEPYHVTLSSIPVEIKVGFTIRQDRLSSIIEAIDTDNNVLTLSNNSVYELDDAVIYTPIRKNIEWFPITCNNPSFFKHFREITFMFLEAQFKNLSFSVYSDSSPDAESTDLIATSLGAWGYGGWGNLPWGGDVGGRQAIRSYIPLEKSRCRWLDLSLTNNQAFTQFAVSGISLMYSLASERDTR